MQKTRSELRKIIMIILYQANIYEERKISYNIDTLIKENLEEENEFVTNSVKGVLNHLLELDAIANNLMVDWTIDRIDKTGASIMRLALFELKYTDTPPAVVINEAINLAKSYCDESVRKIINAVLDKYINE